MAHTLFVIEAPGKVETLRGLLAGIPGLGDFQIVATRGHFWRMPQGLDPLYIDENLKEQERKPDDFVVQRLLEGVEGATEVVLATDADAEGEVIARDVALVLGSKAPLLSRMRLRALALDAVIAAYEARGEFRPQTAASGDTRRVLDRIMGATLMDRAKKVFSGRVQSALLTAISKKAPPVGEAIIQLNAADGGRPFIARVPFAGDERSKAEILVDRVLALPPAKVGSEEERVRAKPWTFGEAVVHAHAATGMPVGKVATAMQSLYESGRMSYPRSSATAVHESTLSTLEKIAKHHKIKFDRRNIPTIHGNGVDGVSVSHPSAAPLGEVDVASALKTLSPEERVLAVIGRNLVASGVQQVIQKPDLEGYPEWMKKLEFERVEKALPWERNLKARMVDYDPEAAAMLAMMKTGVGRPSTLVSHAEKFMSRGLVDANFNLTEKGRDWVKALPPSIGKISPALLEYAFDLLPGSPEERVRAIMAMIGEAGADIVKRFEEVSGHKFPELPDRAEVQLKANKLKEEIKIRREIEAGRVQPEVLQKPEFKSTPIHMRPELR
jgi:DNA topoisomerase-1